MKRVKMSILKFFFYILIMGVGIEVAHSQVTIYASGKRPISTAEFERPSKALRVGYSNKLDEQNCAGQLKARHQGLLQLTPYGGRAPAVTDLLAGHLDVICSSPDRGFEGLLRDRQMVVVTTLNPSEANRQHSSVQPAQELSQPNSSSKPAQESSLNAARNIEEQWLGLAWRGVTKAQFRLNAASMRIDDERLAEIMKSTIWGESHRRDYKTVLDVEQPPGTKLLCVSIGSSSSQYTKFVLDTATDRIWTSNFCRHRS